MCVHDPLVGSEVGPLKDFTDKLTSKLEFDPILFVGAAVRLAESEYRTFFLFDFFPNSMCVSTFTAGAEEVLSNRVLIAIEITD